MRNIFFNAVLIVGLIGTTVESQTEVVKPSQEHKKLGLLIGEWAYEGEQSESPIGPKGAFAGKINASYVLGGFFVQATWEENNPAGKLSGMDIFSYDGKSKTYVQNGFMSDGIRMIGTATIADDTLSSELTVTTPQGEQIPFKAVWQFTPDGTSFTSTWKYSLDGRKTWTHWTEYRAKKKG